MWDSGVRNVNANHSASPHAGARRQLTRWDAHATPADPSILVEQDDNNPLAGSDWEEQLRLVRKLRAGQYGFVWCCLDRESGAKVAIKFIARDERTIDKNVEREIINHSGLMHPHIVEFKICFLTAKYLAIAMEYVEGQNLLRQEPLRASVQLHSSKAFRMTLLYMVVHRLVNAKQGVPEDEARWLYQQLILAVDYTHR